MLKKKFKTSLKIIIIAIFIVIGYVGLKTVYGSQPPTNKNKLENNLKKSENALLDFEYDTNKNNNKTNTDKQSSIKMNNSKKNISSNNSIEIIQKKEKEVINLLSNSNDSLFKNRFKEGVDMKDVFNKLKKDDDIDINNKEKIKDNIKKEIDKKEYKKTDFFGIVYGFGGDLERQNLALTDIIKYFYYNVEKDELIVLTIPRDILINIDNYQGKGKDIKGIKINYLYHHFVHKYLNEGIDSSLVHKKALKSTTIFISDLFNIPINYYVVLNFDGFISFVDGIDGIDVDNEENLYWYEDIIISDLANNKGIKGVDNDINLEILDLEQIANKQQADLTRYEKDIFYKRLNKYKQINLEKGNKKYENIDFVYFGNKIFAKKKFLEKGKNNLSGEEALKFARTRKQDTDYKRTQRQDQLIKALIDKFKSSSFTVLREGIETVYNNVDTNFNMLEALYLAKNARVDNIINIGLNGECNFKTGEFQNKRQEFCLYKVVNENKGRGLKPISNIATVKHYLNTIIYTPNIYGCSVELQGADKFEKLNLLNIGVKIINEKEINPYDDFKILNIDGCQRKDIKNFLGLK